MKAFLRVVSWHGVVPGASHYQGTLKIDGKEYEVTRPLTAAEAKQLNKEARRDGATCNIYKKDGPSGRFFSEESLIEAGIEIVKRDHPGVKLLILGDSAILDPQQVIMGDEPLKSILTELWLEAVANDHWEGDEAKMQDISDRWEASIAWVG